MSAGAVETPAWVEAERAQTPGVAHVLHLNHAGAALLPQVVLDAQLDYMALEAREGGYEAQAMRAEAIAAVYDACARLIGADGAHEIAFAPSATRAWQMAFYGVALGPGDVILTSESAYGSNFIAYLHQQQRRGCAVEVIPPIEAGPRRGQIDVAALRQRAHELGGRLKLIALTHVPSQSGLINPAAEVGQVAREVGALYLLDACQALGQTPVDVQTIGCDMLCATGRKYLRAPRGTGFLYIRHAVLERLDPPLLDSNGATWVEPGRYELHDDARRFESWECNVAAKLGLGAAVELLLSLGVERTTARVQQLAASLRAQLAALPGVEVQDRGEPLAGIVTMTLGDGVDLSAVQHALRAQRINVAVAPTQAALLDMRRKGVDHVLRASPHYVNTAEELERFVAALAGLL